MKTVTMTIPKLTDFTGGTAFQFPDDFTMPYTVLIREAYTRYQADIKKAPTQFNFPGYGVLTMQGRRYTFEFNEQYAAKKGYAMRKEGVWG